MAAKSTNARMPDGQRPEAGRPNAVPTPRRLARRVLVTFLLTFAVARILVFLIMTRVIPDLFVHMGGTHIHHLNYGIFLLAGVGAYLIFARPAERHLVAIATLYGIGLGLTFDEFGMWLHLGGGYWQRASFDAVVVIASALAALAAAPPIGQFRPRHWYAGAAIVLVLTVFTIGLLKSLHHAGRGLGPKLQQLEERAPL